MTNEYDLKLTAEEYKINQKSTFLIKMKYYENIMDFFYKCQLPLFFDLVILGFYGHTKNLVIYYSFD